MLEKYTEPAIHDPVMKGRNETFLGFHLDVAEQLIGSHTLCHRSSQTSPSESTTPPRLNTNQRYYPIPDTKKEVHSMQHSRTQDRYRHTT